MNVLILLTFIVSIVNVVSSISLLDAYRSDRAKLRRQGQANTRFRPVMHLRGDDDWRKQIGQESLVDQMMDENGIIYDLNPIVNEKLPSFFNNYNAHSRLGRK